MKPNAAPWLCDEILRAVNALHIGRNGKLAVHSIYAELDDGRLDLDEFGEALGQLVQQGVFESELYQEELYLSLTEHGYARASAVAMIPPLWGRLLRTVSGLLRAQPGPSGMNQRRRGRI